MRFKLRNWWGAYVATSVAVASLTACGYRGLAGAGQTAATESCVTVTAHLIPASAMPTPMSLEMEPARTTTLGGLGPDQLSPRYPDYRGAASQYFYWTGLQSAEGSTASPSAFEPAAFPHSGSLYSQHPSQVIQIAEQVSDFGAVSDAQHWMTQQRLNNPPNDKPMYGNGVTTNPAMPVLGDDTFAYQIDVGAPYQPGSYTGPLTGDVYTNLEVRQGSVIYAIAIDAAPQYPALSEAETLILAQGRIDAAACAVPLPTQNPTASSAQPTRAVPSPASTTATLSGTVQSASPGAAVTPAPSGD